MNESTSDHLRQSGARHDRDREIAVLAQPPGSLGELVGSTRAVEADERDLAVDLFVRVLVGPGQLGLLAGPELLDGLREDLVGIEVVLPPEQWPAG